MNVAHLSEKAVMMSYSMYPVLHSKLCGLHTGLSDKDSFAADIFYVGGVLTELA